MVVNAWWFITISDYHLCWLWQSTESECFSSAPRKATGMSFRDGQDKTLHHHTSFLIPQWTLTPKKIHHGQRKVVFRAQTHRAIGADRWGVTVCQEDKLIYQHAILPSTDADAEAFSMPWRFWWWEHAKTRKAHQWWLLKNKFYRLRRVTV